MHVHDICWMATGLLDPDTNLTTVKAFIPITDEFNAEHFGDIAHMPALGVTSLPYPADAAGHAEGVVLRECGNTNGIVVGGWDERCAHVAGALQPGDTCVHATDPNASAQIQLKANRQAVLMAKDEEGHDMVAALDGKNGKVQIAAFGALIEIDKHNDRVTLTNPSGKASIMLSGDQIVLAGKVHMGGVTPALVPMCAPAATAQATAAALTSATMGGGTVLAAANATMELI